MRAFQHIKHFLRLPSDLQVNHQVRKNFKHNFISNTLDGSIWLLGESFVSVNTILPVFASTLTDSAILIGLVPALINAGWFIPQLFLAGYVKRLPQKLPFAMIMGFVERIPYLALPLTAFLLHWISQDAALWLFMIVVTWRGFAGGMVALPWQEMIATVIPSPVRSRFFGVTNTIGRFLGVIGSAATGIILAHFTYPNNYALSFLIGAVFIWISFIFFCRTIEPSKDEVAEEKPGILQKLPLLDMRAFKRILNDDRNFRHYLTSRIFFQLGSMAAGFLAVYGIQRFSLADEQAAIFSAFLFASGTLGFSFWGVFGDQVGPRKILLISDLGQVIVLVVAFIAPSIYVYYLIFIIFGFAQSGYVIGELILGMELGTEADRPIYLGLARSVPGVFILIAPLIGGTLITFVGFQTMFLVALCFSIVGLYFLYRVRDRNQILSHEIK